MSAKKLLPRAVKPRWWLEISVPNSARQVAQAALAGFGGLDIPVNNAGGADRAPITWEGENFDEWAESFEQNFFSAVRLASLKPDYRNR
jgi:NAD(P)-dependent dehydrogenase (short-subunit alcohol dehydrogenase family)